MIRKIRLFIYLTFSVLIIVVSAIVFAADNDDDDGNSGNENSIIIRDVSVDLTTSGDGSKTSINQSTSIGNITSINEGGESSIQIGSVSNGEVNCTQLEGSSDPSSFSKIVTDRGNINLEKHKGAPVCVKGSNNKIHVKKNSDIGNLYIDGADNEIYITDATSVKNIDIVGQRNIFILPKRHNISIKGLGKKNKIITSR